MRICNFNGSRSNYTQIRVFPTDFIDFYKIIKSIFQLEFPNEVFYKKKQAETHILVFDQLTYHRCLIDFTLQNFTRLYYCPINVNESVRPLVLIAESKDNPQNRLEVKQHFFDSIGVALVDSQIVFDGEKIENVLKLLSPVKYLSPMKLKEKENSRTLDPIQEEMAEILHSEFCTEEERKQNNILLKELEIKIKGKIIGENEPFARANTKGMVKEDNDFRGETENLIWSVLREKIPMIVNEIIWKFEGNKKIKREEMSQSFFVMDKIL